MIDQIFEGVIGVWNRSYGFIDFESGARVDSIFYPGKNIVPDNVGRTGSGKIVGSQVNFKIVKAPWRGELRPCAVGVTPIFASNVPDPEKHREVSTVERLAPSGIFLRRKTGEELFLNLSDVLPEFHARIATLRVSDHVFHGVAPSIKNSTAHFTWRATAAELFSREEQESLWSS